MQKEGGGGKTLGSIINTLPKAKSETTLPRAQIVEIVELFLQEPIYRVECYSNDLSNIIYS